MQIKQTEGLKTLIPLARRPRILILVDNTGEGQAQEDTLKKAFEGKVEILRSNSSKETFDLYKKESDIDIIISKPELLWGVGGAVEDISLFREYFADTFKGCIVVFIVNKEKNGRYHEQRGDCDHWILWKDL